MNLQMRKATEQDLDSIALLYDTLNDYLEANENYPGWRKGIYPTREDAQQGLKENCLFVALMGDRMVGSFILRNKPEEAYYQAIWQKELSYNKVYVIYTFAVHPEFFSQGIGSKMLSYASQYAKNQGMEALRLDVTEKNLPAIHLYEKNNFEYIDTVDLGLEEYGLKWFRLYERLL